MILYPAIDLKDGQCVRLLRGEMSAATVFGDDPAAQALKFHDAGCASLTLECNKTKAWKRGETYLHELLSSSREGGSLSQDARCSSSPPPSC